MTISNETSQEKNLGNGLTTVFGFNFKINQRTHLKVIKVDALGNKTSLVEGNGENDYILNNDFNSIIYPATGTNILATGESIFLQRVVPLLQEIDLKNQGAFKPQVVENGLDHGIMVDIQQQLGIDKSLRAPDTSDLENIFLPETLTPNTVLKVNSTGDGFVNGPLAGDIAQATAKADIAANSAAAALTSEANAATSEANAAASEANAAASEANAAASEANAATSETNAATSETEAATSAANAEASKDAADIFADAAATSAASAATSKTEAEASRNDAENSAAAALTSETNAATSKTEAATSATGAEASRVLAEAAATDAEANRVLAETAATGAEASRVSAETAAGVAATSKTEAATSATGAEASKNAAENFADAAATSAASAAASKSSLVELKNIILGSSNTAPTQRPNGTPLTGGEQYFNTVENNMFVYDSVQNSWRSVFNAGSRTEYIYSNVPAGTTKLTSNPNSSNNEFTNVSDDGLTLSYTLKENISIHVMGVNLDGSHFTIFPDGSTIEFTTPLPITSNITISVFKALAAGDIIPGSETAAGVVQYATDTETVNGTLENRAVHPKGLASALNAIPPSAVKATAEQMYAGTNDTAFITPLLLAQKLAIENLGHTVFTYTGTTQSWGVPSNVSMISVILVGGGGGSAASRHGDGGGGGGGGGNCLVGNNIPVTPGDVISIVVGGGGAGGSSFSANGNDGGYTTVYCNNPSSGGNWSLKAYGGKGGKPFSGGSSGYPSSSSVVNVSSVLYGNGGEGGAAYDGGGGGGGAGGIGGHGGEGQNSTNMQQSSGDAPGQYGGAGGTTHGASLTHALMGGTGGAGQYNMRGGGGGGTRVMPLTKYNELNKDINGENVQSVTGTITLYGRTFNRIDIGGAGGWPGGGAGGGNDDQRSFGRNGGDGVVYIVAHDTFPNAVN